MLWCDQYGFHKRSTGTRYAKLVFFNSVGSVGHIVHSGMTGVQKVAALFLMLGGTTMNSTKSVPGHVTSNMCFCIRWDMLVT
jgi:hypothetical protein